MEGNPQKMREALEAINCINIGGLKRLGELVEADIFDGGLINKTIFAVEKARRALSSPEMEMEANNAATMHEALEYADNELRRATEDSRYGDDVVYLVGCMRTVAAACRAALSAPPRNCDIYTTSGKAGLAITEYCSKMAETGECVKSCPYREAKGGCAFGWILAAAGTKGDGNGSK